MSKVRELIQKLVDERVPIITRPAVVSEVSGKTCTVIFSDDDTELPDVRLSASTGADDNWRVKPKVGSSVLVSIISKDEHSAFISLVDEVASFGITIDGTTFDMTKDSIIMNGGDNGGITIAPELKSQLEKSDSYLTTLKTATKAMATALDALIPGTSAAFEAAMTGKTVGDYSSITNDKVKH